MPSIITFDLHSGDRISDIQFCIEWLSRAGIPALFFVPTGMLHDKGFVEILTEAHKRGVKIGTVNATGVPVAFSVPITIRGLWL